MPEFAVTFQARPKVFETWIDSLLLGDISPVARIIESLEHMNHILHRYHED